MKQFYKSIDKLLKRGYAIIQGKIIDYKKCYYSTCKAKQEGSLRDLWSAYYLFLARKLLHRNPSGDSLTVIVLFNLPEGIANPKAVLQVLQKIFNVIEEKKLILPQEEIKNIFTATVTKTRAFPSIEILLIKENKDVLSKLVLTLYEEFMKEGTANKMAKAALYVQDVFNRRKVLTKFKTKFCRLYQDSKTKAIIYEIEKVWNNIARNPFIVEMKDFKMEIDLDIDYTPKYEVGANKHDNVSGGIFQRKIETKGASC